MQVSRSIQFYFRHESDLEEKRKNNKIHPKLHENEEIDTNQSNKNVEISVSNYSHACYLCYPSHLQVAGLDVEAFEARLADVEVLDAADAELLDESLLLSLESKTSSRLS